MDSPWARTMRTRYGFFISLVVLVLVSVGLYFYLHKPISCFDAIQNQNETGVDCGGVCSLACTHGAKPLVTSWVLPFEVSPGWWSILAYVQNPNFGVYAEEVPYAFTLYDAQGTRLAEERGSTFIRNEPTIPVFLGRVSASTSISRVSFSWLHDPVWKQVRKDYVVKAEEVQEAPVTGGHEVYAVIHNTEPIALRDITVIVVVYGAGQNAMAVSQTYVDKLPAYGSRRVTFAWPKPFESAVRRVEVFPRVSPNQ